MRGYIYIFFGFCLIFFAGCPHKDPTTETDVTGDALTRADTKADAAEKKLVDVVKETDGKTRYKAEDAKSNVTSLREDLKEGKESNKEAAQKIINLDHEITKMKGSTAWKIGTAIVWAGKIIITAYLLHVILGAAALYVPGIWGAGMAIISVVVWPFSWFTAIRENLWFRKFSPVS